MKSNTCILIVLLYGSYLAAAILPPTVYDKSQQKVIAGIRYYILPISRGHGGITIASTRNKTCPLDVAQELSVYNRGLGVTFNRVDASAHTVRVSTDLTIKFSSPAKACAQSSYWKVDGYDNLRARYFVTIGGVGGKHSGKSLPGTFRIEKEGNGYKIVYCRPVNCVATPCEPVCKNVGVYEQHGGILLALADEPLVVKFRKVYEG
ncbi:hypothetical protein DCAR_0624200 [Daucus carota subsp. sativus]|uniref:Uncharacterized protein n=1 Tax=Daucus carota subsp. sativus TaxID=79200 RepID=A0A164VPQ7_DAUCS|nr:PREDICTED: miraculin-like [Daucus carota subsp. sativus]WOH04788.1 hypothetical protein DCAR_0624200 [Daucus carota subsp. sativus]